MEALQLRNQQQYHRYHNTSTIGRSKKCFTLIQIDLLKYVSHTRVLMEVQFTLQFNTRWEDIFLPFKRSLLFYYKLQIWQDFYKNWAPIGNSVFETDFTTVLLQTNIGRIKVASHHTCEKRKELCYYPTTPKLYD